MSRGKKWLIAVLILVTAIAVVFYVFHDDADVEAIEKEQLKDIEEKVPENFDDLNASFEDFEEDSLQ